MYNNDSSLTSLSLVSGDVGDVLVLNGVFLFEECLYKI